MNYEKLREILADLAHKQWAGWMEYLFRKSEKQADGTVVIPKWAVDRWQRQIETPYVALSKAEQDSDRKEADRFLKIFALFLTSHALYWKDFEEQEKPPIKLHGKSQDSEEVNVREYKDTVFRENRKG